MSLPGNFGNAFDLSALKNPISENEIYGVDVNQSNLVAEFLPASNQLPVIIACWSAKSKQSLDAMRGLGLLFDEIADLGTNAPWLLGNLNVDKEAPVAKALQIPSVPFAIALIGEQLVPLFETLPTPDQLRLVVDRVVTLAAERGVGRGLPAGEGAVDHVEAEPEEALEPEEELALAALENSDYEGAKRAYEQWLSRAPGSTVAQLGLAQVSLLARIDGLDHAAVLAAASAQPTSVALVSQASDIEIAQGNYDGAFARLINTVKLTSGDDRKAAREHLVMLFSLVDPSDPVLAKARQQLASALF